MVLMSGDTDCATGKVENSQGESNTDSVSSDSGISNCSKEDSSRNQRDKSTSPSQPQPEEKHGKSNFFQRFPRRASDRDYSEFFDDPFFSEKGSKLFGSRSRLGNKPRLSERIFGNKKTGSVFDNDHFVDDLRRKIQEEKKMFFDGASDPFASAFGGGARPTSPVGGAGRANFPFEDLRSGARARFDEFANRHPMFSTMRNQPAWNLDDPFGHHGFTRERHHSGSSGAGSGASTASTGEERVIPIQIIRDDPPKAQQQQQQQQQRGKSPSPPSAVPSRLARESSPQPPSSSEAAGPQRCNTEPNHTIFVEDARSARAHSAPPTSQNGNEKIPLGMSTDTNDSKPQATQVGGNCSKSPKGEPAPNPNAAGGVRSIPIILEGRKVPVVNSTLNGSCNTGQSPPQAKVSRPAERSPTPPPKKPAPPKDPLAQVNAVYEEVKELEKQVDDFKGNSREDREFLVLDEMLTRCLIKLDVVETEGRDDVRTTRKDCIRYIQSCISKLEKKASSSSQAGESGQGEQPMEIASQNSKSEENETMDTVSTTGETKPLQDQQNEGRENTSQKMEVDTSSTNSSEGKSNQSTNDVKKPENA